MGRWLSPAYTSSENGEGGGAVDLDEIEALGTRLGELCRKYGIAELAVFGVDWAVVWKITQEEPLSWRNRCWRSSAPSVRR
jgi:hypothetical protein